MNEFERRLLEVVRNRRDLVGLVQVAGRNVLVEHFGYVVKIGSTAEPLLDGVTQSKVLAMQSDAWFVLSYVNSCVIRAESSYWFTDSGNIRLDITDTGNGQSLFNQPFSAGVVTATVNRPQTGIPMLLPIPRVIPPNTNIKVDATQQGVALDNTEPLAFWLALNGSRVSQV